MPQARFQVCVRSCSRPSTSAPGRQLLATIGEVGDVFPNEILAFGIGQRDQGDTYHPGRLPALSADRKHGDVSSTIASPALIHGW